MQLQDAIKKRKSVRRFGSKKPDWRKIIQAIDSGRFAPMAGGQYTIRFILVDDEEKIEAIKNACQQDFVKAPYVLVVVSNRKLVKKMYDNQNKEFGAQQAGAAIENVLLSLTEKKLATCWVGYFAEGQIKKTLDIPEDYEVEAVLPIGFETAVKKKQKQKPDLEKVLFFDKFGNKEMRPQTRVRHEWS